MSLVADDKRIKTHKMLSDTMDDTMHEVEDSLAGYFFTYSIFLWIACETLCTIFPLHPIDGAFGHPNEWGGREERKRKRT